MPATPNDTMISVTLEMSIPHELRIDKLKLLETATVTSMQSDKGKKIGAIEQIGSGLT